MNAINSNKEADGRRIQPALPLLLPVLSSLSYSADGYIRLNILGYTPKTATAMFSPKDRPYYERLSDREVIYEAVVSAAEQLVPHRTRDTGHEEFGNVMLAVRYDEAALFSWTHLTAALILRKTCNAKYKQTSSAYK